MAIEAIAPAAKKHCNNLRISAVTVPGVPAKSFILYPPKTQEKTQNLDSLTKSQIYHNHPTKTDL